VRSDIAYYRDPLAVGHELLEEFSGNSGFQVKEVIAEPFYREDNQVGLTCRGF